MKPIHWILILGVAGVAGWFFFGVYDTAIGKCNRGDLGACTVVVAQQAQVEADQRAANEYARQADPDALWLDQQDDRYSDPSVIRCDVVQACAQDVNPFPLAPMDGGIDWCVKWTDESQWRYGDAFLALDSDSQEAVRSYCERGEMPPVLPAVP